MPGADKALKSLDFMERAAALTGAYAGGIQKAIDRVLQDPENDDYKRSYLGKYRQEHCGHKQIKLFFEVRAAEGIVYFIWINDQTCLHDTLKNHGDDPCVKEFIRRKNENLLELFHKATHEGLFEVEPIDGKPSYIRYSKFDAEIHCNMHLEGDTCVSVSIESEPEDLDETYDILELFLENIAIHFKTKTKKKFKFTLDPIFYREVIRLIKKTADPKVWSIDTARDRDETVIKLK